MKLLERPPRLANSSCRAARFKRDMMGAPDNESRLRDFRRSLDEALAWCSKRFTMYDLAESLRSKELAPQDQECSAIRRPDVETVIAKRRQALPRVESQDVERQAWWGALAKNLDLYSVEIPMI